MFFADSVKVQPLSCHTRRAVKKDRFVVIIHEWQLRSGPDHVRLRRQQLQRIDHFCRQPHKRRIIEKNVPALVLSVYSVSPVSVSELIIFGYFILKKTYSSFDRD